jgi:hypothetical protein
LAHAAYQLNVRRSATLLACQGVRERRRRIDVLRAEQARASAAAAEEAAREQRNTSNALSAARLTEAHESVRSRVIDLHELKRLMTVEHCLRQEAVAAELAFIEAHEKFRKAELALADAASLLQSEVRTTHRRERLAGKMLGAWRRAAEMAAEAESEEQAADSWNAV